MDSTVQKALKICVILRRSNVFARFKTRTVARLVQTAGCLVMVCCAVCSTGCQANRWLNQSALPVPEPVLDADALQNIRYQSPGANASGPAGILNKASHRMGTVTDRVVDDNVDQSQLVSNVRFTGNQTIPVHQLRRNISTRPGRYFDPVKLQQDVTKLWQMPAVASVNGPYIDRSPAGVSVTFDIVEQTKLNVVEFIGNRGVSDKLLLKESGLVDQTHFDAYQIRTARKRIEDLYREKGYPRTQVEIVEGEKKTDSKVVFLIHEDEQQKIWKVEFEGNTIASDGRLKSFVKGKPGIAKVFGGLARRDVIEEDIVRLESYYRSLGFLTPASVAKLRRATMAGGCPLGSLLTKALATAFATCPTSATRFTSHWSWTNWWNYDPATRCPSLTSPK